MATIEHCLYAFEALVAKLERRKPLTIDEVESSYGVYRGAKNLLPPPADSKKIDNEARYPLFVTWEQQRRESEPYALRGCIGTFSGDDPLSECLAEYAVIAGLRDSRFPKITLGELPSLRVDVTLLTDFEECKDMFDWTIGKHGIKIAFRYKGESLSATYLPSVAEEQEWTQEQTLKSLMRKAGWNGREAWEEVANDGGIIVVRYQGLKSGAKYSEFQDWRDWYTETHKSG